MNQSSPSNPATESANIWRYVAVEAQSCSQTKRSGELVAATAADARASLRRIGLQVIEVRPLRRRHAAPAINMRWLKPIADDLRDWWHARCRAQRAPQRAEFYDSLATMLASGLPLLEATQALVESRGRARGGLRETLIDVRERLRGGDSLAQAMTSHPGWFDAIDIAIVEAGQHGGNQALALAGLAQRQERSNELGHRLTAALAYPVLVLLVGLGVVVFLSVKTLPNLTKILEDNHIAIPGLTARVMWLGQTLAAHWLTVAIALPLAGLAWLMAPRLVRGLSAHESDWRRRLRRIFVPPRVIRQLLVGGLVAQLAELLRSGVPMVDALRVVAPTQRSERLRQVLRQGAAAVERGDELSIALHDPLWFDPEMQRLLDIGQASGELEAMLARIGERYQRRAKRLIDRLTTLLEPAVLLLLAFLVGTVVMAAVLPLLALQEIIR